MSLDEIKRKREEDPTKRDAILEKTKQEIKERNLKKQQAKKQEKAKINKNVTQKVQAPKNAPK